MQMSVQISEYFNGAPWSYCWFLLIVHRAFAGRRPLYERAYVRSHQAADNWLRVFRSVTMFICAPCSYHYFIISKKVIVRAARRGSRCESVREKRLGPLRYYFINVVFRVTRIVRSWLSYICIIYRPFSFPTSPDVCSWLYGTICSVFKNGVASFCLKRIIISF